MHQAFNLPPQLYYLGTECAKTLENRCWHHYNLHAEWVYTAQLEQEALKMAEMY